mmetsp:Transcript_35663/g.40080  ORF Transcript_35663/g.40080 Transcript_35663/m.40080 type:complete len:257 (+) Transcript_35663:294-1064(+)
MNMYMYIYVCVCAISLVYLVVCCMWYVFIYTVNIYNCIVILILCFSISPYHKEIDVNEESKRYSPTYITLLEKPIETLEEQRLEHETDDRVKKRKVQLQDREKRKPKPVSQEINDYVGSFLHRIHIEDAIVDVCIRASKASPQQPMLFHLRLEELDEDVMDQFEQEKADQVRPPLLGVEHHWSFMETQFNRIEHEIHTIIKEADFFRERDALYHQQTDELHKATLFWPILHCFILVLTGFTQANHIISFFKTRRII